MQEFEKQFHTDMRRYHAAQLEWTMRVYPEPEPWVEIGLVGYYNSFSQDLEQEISATEWNLQIGMFVALFEAEHEPTNRCSLVLKDPEWRGGIREITNLRLYNMNNRLLSSMLISDRMMCGPASTDRWVSVFAPEFVAKEIGGRLKRQYLGL